MYLGSISAALSCLVYPPREERGRSAGSFPEQRLVIDPTVYYTVTKHSEHLSTLKMCRKHSPAARAFYISLMSSPVMFCPSTTYSLGFLKHFFIRAGANRSTEKSENSGNKINTTTTITKFRKTKHKLPRHIFETFYYTRPSLSSFSESLKTFYSPEYSEREMLSVKPGCQAE